MSVPATAENWAWSWQSQATTRSSYFARDRESFGFLSHFHAAPLVLDGTTWPTVEHFYQAQKSSSHAYRQAILAAPTPGAAKALAASPSAPNKQRKRSWFAKNNASPRPDWHAAKLDIMRRGDLAKFTQHEDSGQLLLATGDAELIEDSPRTVLGNRSRWSRIELGRAGAYGTARSIAQRRHTEPRCQLTG